MNEKRAFSIVNVIYLVVTMIFIIGVNVLSDEIFLWCDMPRKIQMVWMFGVCGITLWKIMGYYAMSNLRVNAQTIENLILSTVLFLVLTKIFLSIGVPFTMHLIVLILLVIFDVINREGKVNIRSKALIVISYLGIGGVWCYSQWTDGVLWNKNYSLFSHFYMMTVGIILFLSLTGKMPLVIQKIMRKFYGGL